MPVLQVVPTEFRGAATIVGETVAAQLRLCWQGLVSALDSCGGMAGSDEAGVAWGGSYEEAARSANMASVNLLNSCSHLGALLDQTGVNYARAEAASVSGAAHPPAVVARFSGDWYDWLDDVATAVEAGTPPPPGWSLLAHLIQKAWPDGHQDRLHHAAEAWRKAAQQLLATLDEVVVAFHMVLAQDVPESDAAATVLDTIGDEVVALAQGYTGIADACDQYAHNLDEAHHAIISELRDFLIWTAGLETAGGLFAVFTLGISEAIAQGSEAYAMVRFANTIRRLIEVLVAAARSTSMVVTAAAARFEMVAARLRPILAKHLEEVRVASAGDRGSIQIGKLVPSKLGARAEATTPTGKAITELEDASTIGPASETWGDPTTLAKHFRDHAADFGAASEQDYARMAAEFFRRAIRDKLPMKIEREKGIIRFYDAETNTFGTYRLNGQTRTFYKPSGGLAYWTRQKGVLVHG